MTDEERKRQGFDVSLDKKPHICNEQFACLQGMRELYNTLRIIPTSTNADTVLIRSHIAYWSGNKEVERAVIKPSRGHSYRVNGSVIVKIRDEYDHRDGVTGWTWQCPNAPLLEGVAA